MNGGTSIALVSRLTAISRRELADRTIAPGEAQDLLDTIGNVERLIADLRDNSESGYGRALVYFPTADQPENLNESFRQQTAKLASEARNLVLYREGFSDALRWVLNVFNLDTEDEDELRRVLDGGSCEGSKA